MLKLPKEHLSVSQINLWESDPIAYQKKYFIGIPDPPSPFLEFGKQFAKDIEDYAAGGPEVSINAVGSVYTVQLNFIPDPSFKTFMDSRSIGDRRMQIWCKFGNTNVLVFDDQAFTEGAGDEALIMEQNIFVDHSDNTTTSALTNPVTSGLGNLFEGMNVFGARPSEALSG